MVLYFPDVKVYRNIERALEQVEHLVVVNNTGSETKVNFSLLLNRRENITFLNLEENIGIAGALNLGMKEAKGLHFNAVLLLDQDTELLHNAVEELLTIFTSYTAQELVSMIGSDCYQEQDKAKKNLHGEHTYIEARSVITSGTLLIMKAYVELGPFNERYFIDGVDIEYSLRARKAGFIILRSTTPLMNHFIGDVTVHNIAFWRLATRNHSPVRRYYIARNSILIGREYGGGYTREILDLNLKTFVMLLLIALFETNKKNKIQAILTGLKDGIMNKAGKIKPGHKWL